MSGDEIGIETKESIHARLRLSQQLLEEADGLLDANAPKYDFQNERLFVHPRHEREALVVYLLLTCFDKLGQRRRHISFVDWLATNKEVYASERDVALHSLNPDSSPIECAAKLARTYQDIYGVKNAFVQGIQGLPTDLRGRLLRNVEVVFRPEYGCPNATSPLIPIEDCNKKLKLKLDYLYGMRNRFTHDLHQLHYSSSPTWGSAWRVFIKNSRITYAQNHSEHIMLKTGGAHRFSCIDWPFVLFETLYAAIGVQFDRTTIDLSFSVSVFTQEGPGFHFDGVKHKDLKTLAATSEFGYYRPTPEN